MRPTLKPALLILFLVCAALVWYWAGARPQHWDSAIHLTESLNASRIGADVGQSVVHQALFVSWYYPPFVSYAAIPLYRLFGESEQTGFIVMTFWYCLLVAATYALGASLYSPQAGLAAAALTAAFPVVVEFSHMFMLDLPLAAMAALTVLLLVRSENFSRIPCGLLAGVAFGCGMLTKWTFPILVLGPALMTLAGALKKNASRRRRLWVCAAAVAAAVLIAAPWYLVHAVQIVASRGGELREGDVSGPGVFLYYLTIIPLQTSWLLAIPLAAGIVLFIVRVRTRGVFLGVWFVTAYLFLSLIGFKMPRFSIGLLTPVALAAAGGIAAQLASRWVRAVFFALCTAVFLAASYIPAESVAGRLLGTPLWGSPLLKTDGPSGDGWHQREIAQRIAEDARTRGIVKPNVRVVPDLVFCNSSTLGYQALLYRLPVNVTGISGYPLLTDYAVVTTGRTSDAGAEDERARLSKRIFGDAPRVYTEVARWPLPDSSQAVLFRVDPEPAAGARPELIVAALRSSVMQFVGRYMRPVAATQIGIEEYTPAETRRGKIRELRIRSQEADLGDFTFTPVGLRVRDVDIVLRDICLDPNALATRGSLDIYGIGGVEFRGIRLAAGDLAAYAKASANLSLDELKIEGGALAVRLMPPGFGRTISLRVTLETLGGRDIGFTVRELSVAGIPVPSALANTMLSPFTPLLSGLRSVREVHLGTLVLEHDRLELR